MARYIKLPTIVDAYPLVSPIDLGSLGIMSTGDWLINLYNGSMQTMASNEFLTLYVETGSNVPLGGTDWN